MYLCSCGYRQFLGWRKASFPTPSKWHLWRLTWQRGTFSERVGERMGKTVKPQREGRAMVGTQFMISQGTLEVCPLIHSESWRSLFCVTQNLVISRFSLITSHLSLLHSPFSIHLPFSLPHFEYKFIVHSY